MTDMMALDAESGRLVKKARFGEDGGGSGSVGGSSGSGAGGIAAGMSPVKGSRRKPRGQGVFLSNLKPCVGDNKQEHPKGIRSPKRDKK